MKSEITEKKGCVVHFKIQVPKEEMTSFENKVIDDYMKNAPVKGFRAGKAPRAMVLRTYSSNIKKDVLSNNLIHLCDKAFAEKAIRPITDPMLEELHYEFGQDLAVSGAVEVYPEFELADWKGMELKKMETGVDDKEVDEYIKFSAEYNAPFENVETRALEEGDYAIVDYEIFEGENSAEKRDGVWMKLGNSDPLLKEFSDQTKGMKIGEERSFEITMPENFANKSVAGKKARIRVVLKGIRIKVMPEINDEYVKKLGQEEKTLDEYRAKVKERLSHNKTHDADLNLKNQVKNNLLKDNRFDIPPSILKGQTDQLFLEQVKLLKSRGYDDARIKKESEEIFKTVYEKAVNQVRLEFIYGKIISAEKIDASGEDVNRTLDHEAQEMGISRDELSKYIKANNRMEVFKQRIQVDKALELIINHAKVS